MIIWYILLAIFLLWVSTEYMALRTGVPTVATFPPARRKIIETLQKDFAERSDKRPYRIIDLGSGNGQMSCKVARALPDAVLTGLEISPVPFMIATLRRALLGPRHNLTFIRQDFWPYDCSYADAMIVFLTPKVIERASQKLRQELKPGTLIVANDLALRGDWQPIEVIDSGLLGMKVYVYRQT